MNNNILIDEQTKSQLASNNYQLSQADALENIILCNIIVNNNKIREYFFNIMESKYFFVKQFYADLFNIMHQEVIHNKPIDFTLLENNIKITDKTQLILLKQFSEQHKESILCINDLDWEIKAKKIYENHNILLLKAQMLQNLKKITEKASSIEDTKQFETVLDNLGKIVENGRNKNRDFDESLTKLTDKKVANKIIRDIFTVDNCIPTGFYNFDSKWFGIPRGGILLITATSGSGKSILALNVAMNMFELGKRVCIVSAEMASVQNMKRILCNIYYRQGKHLCSEDFYSNNSSHNDKLIEELTDNYNKYIDDIKNKYPDSEFVLKCKDNDVTVSRLLNHLKNYKYDLIVIDYLDLLEHDKNKKQWEYLREESQYCKTFAQNNDCIILIAAQREEKSYISFCNALKNAADVFWSWTSISYNSEKNDKCKVDDNDVSGSTLITTVDMIKNREFGTMPFNLKFVRNHYYINGGSNKSFDDYWRTPDIINKVSQSPNNSNVITQRNNNSSTKTKIEHAEPGNDNWDELLSY